MRYLDPKNDLTFKKIFGHHPDLMISLLNALMPFDDDSKIENLEYLSSELTPNSPDLKNTIVDVKCKDSKGRYFIIEIQLIWTEQFTSRVLFNTSKTYIMQMARGSSYDELSTVYSINIINDHFTARDESEYYHYYTINQINKPDRKLIGMEFLFIEIPKFKANSFSQRKLQYLWLKFLSEIENNCNMIPQNY
ncbi:MAG: Rpn family recombination-promoting nuclease/putative transposase [Saprospiraceae bacterium]|nr:Rpn family recombination-promoting nuclease/putative transposase [Saprospiraceae bacterium]